MAEVAKETKPTHISAVIDRSGSMTQKWDDTVGGFQTFLEEQKALPGKTRYNLRVFDTEHELVYDSVERDEATTIPETIKPRGGTALLDAVGQHINGVREFLAENEEFEQVVVAIMTDGYENSSQEFKRANIQKLVQEAEKDGWQFIFMGANINAFQEANNLGMRLSTNVQYDNTSTMDSFVAASASTMNYRSTGLNVHANIDVTDDVTDDESTTREEKTDGK